MDDDDSSEQLPAKEPGPTFGPATAAVSASDPISAHNAVAAVVLMYRGIIEDLQRSHQLAVTASETYRRLFEEAQRARSNQQVVWKKELEAAKAQVQKSDEAKAALLKQVRITQHRNGVLLGLLKTAGVEVSPLVGDEEYPGGDAAELERRRSANRFGDG